MDILKAFKVLIARAKFLIKSKDLVPGQILRYMTPSNSGHRYVFSHYKFGPDGKRYVHMHNLNDDYTVHPYYSHTIPESSLDCFFEVSDIIHESKGNKNV